MFGETLNKGQAAHLAGVPVSPLTIANPHTRDASVTPEERAGRIMTGMSAKWHEKAPVTSLDITGAASRAGGI